MALTHADPRRPYYHPGVSHNHSFISIWWESFAFCFLLVLYLKNTSASVSLKTSATLWTWSLTFRSQPGNFIRLHKLPYHLCIIHNNSHASWWEPFPLSFSLFSFSIIMYQPDVITSVPISGISRGKKVAHLILLILSEIIQHAAPILCAYCHTFCVQYDMVSVDFKLDQFRRIKSEFNRIWSSRSSESNRSDYYLFLKELFFLRVWISVLLKL